MTNIETLRRIYEEAQEAGVFLVVDEDIAREAGMDGNLARLLQAARNLDREAAPPSPGQLLDRACAVLADDNDVEAAWALRGVIAALGIEPEDPPGPEYDRYYKLGLDSGRWLDRNL